MSDPARVIVLTKRWPHHTRSGGYDRLAREVGAEVMHRFARSPSWGHAVARSLWRLGSRSRRYLCDYRYEDWRTERSLLAQVRRRPPAAVHVLYGDEELDLLLRSRALLPCPLIATFHLPPTRVRDRFERYQRHLVSGIDAAVMVSRCQLQPFQCWLGPERVVYVPHGIDTERFTPGTDVLPRQAMKLLSVGQHMRDFQTQRRIMDACNARQLPVHFDLVVPREYWPAFASCPNVRMQTGVEEHALVRMYQEADALLLPMIDATANNAALESLACGTPVISNAVGGIPDYVDDNCGWLFEKGEVAGIVELIAAVCSHKEIAASRRAAARRKALAFDWSQVARQVWAVYQAVIAGRPPVAAMETVEAAGSS